MDKVQLRCIRKTVITQSGSLARGDIFWAPRAIADHYIANNIAELIAPVVGPTETKPEGPSEIKKSSVAVQDSRSTDSPESTGIAGADALSLRLRVVPPSPKNSSGKFTLGLRRNHKPRE